MFYEHSGVNILGEKPIKPYDMHCPLMGGAEYKRLNYHSDKCKARQRDPLLRATCYPFCKVTKEGRILAKQLGMIRSREDEAKARLARREAKKERDLIRATKPFVKGRDSCSNISK